MLESQEIFIWQEIFPRVKGGGGGGGGCSRWALRNAWGGGGVPSSVTKRCKGVGGVSSFPEKKRYVTLEWPQRAYNHDDLLSAL